MTTVAVHSRRNWAAVLIFIVGAGAFVFSLLHALLIDTPVSQVANVFVFLLAYFPGVVAVLIAAFVLAFGTGRFAGIAGTSRWGRVTLCAWGLLNAASQVAFVGYLTDDSAHFQTAQEIQLTIAIATVLVGLAAAAFVFRAPVLTGFARVSLFIAIVLYAVTETLLTVAPIDAGGYWDLPRLAGLAILGLSYWRAGLPARAVAVAG